MGSWELFTYVFANIHSEISYPKYQGVLDDSILLPISSMYYQGVIILTPWYYLLVDNSIIFGYGWHVGSPQE